MTCSERMHAGAPGQSDEGPPIYRRVALVGCGRRFVASVAPTLWHTGTVAVLAADPDPEARTRVTAIAPHAEGLILVPHLTRQQLINSGAEAIIISSPSGLHYEHCRTALSCHLPTFVEKPLACTVQDAKSLQVTAQGLLVASEQRIYREDLGYARSVIKSGVLGDISEMRYHDSIVPAPHLSRTWRNDPRLAGGGILLDLGYHTVGSMQWLLDLNGDEIAMMQAKLTTTNLRVEDTAKITCTAGRVVVRLDVRLVQSDPRELIVVRGSRGEFRIERARRKPSIADITVTIRGESPLRHRMPLDERTDSQSLVEFLCGRAEASRLDQHVDVLEFLEQAYMCSGQGERGARDAAEGLA